MERRPPLVTPVFVLIALATLAYFVAQSIVLPVLPLYVRGPLGGSDVAVGVVIGAFSVTALLVRPWAGRLADRRGRRLPMLIGVAIFTLSVAGYVVSRSVPTLVAMRLLTGVGEAFFFTAAASAIADMAPDERRGEAISFFSLALWTGIAVGPVVGEIVLAHGRFSLVWLASAAFGLLAGILALRIRVPAVPGEGGARPRLIHRGALLPGTGILMSIWGAAGFFAFVPLYSRELGLSGSRGVFVLFSGIVLAIRFFGARLPDSLGAVRAARASLVISAAGLAVMGLWGTTVGLFVGTAVYAVGQALAFPALMALALRGVPAGERGAAIATFTAMVDVGFGIGPAALGFVADGFGYGGVFLTGSAVALLGLVLLLTRHALRLEAAD
ncbi:MAG: MFS transporter [Actinomycetota bacterium]